jgi:hypothetical protein
MRATRAGVLRTAHQCLPGYGGAGGLRLPAGRAAGGAPPQARAGRGAARLRRADQGDRHGGGARHRAGALRLTAAPARVARAPRLRLAAARHRVSGLGAGVQARHRQPAAARRRQSERRCAVRRGLRCHPPQRRAAELDEVHQHRRLDAGTRGAGRGGHAGLVLLAAHAGSPARAGRARRLPDRNLRGHPEHLEQHHRGLALVRRGLPDRHRRAAERPADPPHLVAAGAGRRLGAADALHHRPEPDHVVVTGVPRGSRGPGCGSTPRSCTARRGRSGPAYRSTS